MLRAPNAEGQLTFVTTRPARGLALLGEPVPTRPLGVSQGEAFVRVRQRALLHETGDLR